MCGGTERLFGIGNIAEGLSPRVRGNRVVPIPRPLHRRSIPACAGEPLSLSSKGCTDGVYPRVCGGTGGYRNPRSASNGLSPRVRGNHDLTDLTQIMKRSIPACAGEPLAAGRAALGVKVYPRVCGGTTLAMPALSTSTGLSPRVRGNLVIRVVGPLDLRSIPACAGEPSVLPPASQSTTVYPRVCGGTFPRRVGSGS